MKVVFGPGTFINEAAERIDEQLTAQTKQAEARRSRRSGRREGRARARRRQRQAAQAGQQAGSITLARFKEGLATLALQYGLTERPSLENLNFISTLVFESRKPAGTPKQRFATVPEPRSGACVGADEGGFV